MLNTSGTSESFNRLPVIVSARLIWEDDVSEGEITEFNVCQNFLGLSVDFKLLFNIFVLSMLDPCVTFVSSMPSCNQIIREICSLSNFV